MEEKRLSFESLQILNEKVQLQWKEARMELDKCFKNREASKAKPIMEESIKLFYDYLLLSNGTKRFEMEKYDLEPVNYLERLDFIRARPGLYHSYVQLSELFSEQDKLVAKKIALNKLKNKRPD